MSDEETQKIEALANFLRPRASEPYTESFSHFWSEYRENLDSFFFTVDLVRMVDEGRVRAAKALMIAVNPLEAEKYKKSAEDPDAALRQLKKFRRVNSRNLCNNAVNVFQRYLSSIIQEVVAKRPEILRSNESVRIDEILRFKRYKDLVSFMIDRKINELAYGGIRGIETYFKDRLGIELFVDERQRALLIAFIELRNINIHNGGIVNDLFLGRVGTVEGFKFDKGKTYHLDLDELITLGDNALNTATNLDKTVTTKFGIRRKTLASWNQQKP